jgi:hypothetical protein
MIVWGGWDGGYSNTGGRYNPNTDTWTATSITNAPSVRYAPTGVWTGSEMIVWGGYGPPCNPNCSALNTGGRYNPSTDGWTATTTTFAPVPRYDHTAVWTASEMIIWGGLDSIGFLLGTGSRYNPSNNSWTATSATNAPTARFGHTAVWAGGEMIVWGGDAVSTPTARPQLADQPSITENTGGRYCAAAPSPTPTPTATATVTPTATVPPSPTPTPSVCFVIITDPSCGSVITTPPVDFSVALSDPTDPSSIQPTDFMVNGTPADSYITSPPYSYIIFHFNTSPAVPGLNVMHIPPGAFNCRIGGTPEVTCTFTYQPSTPTPTPTLTPRPSPTPRVAPTPRVRPTPPPRL